MSTGIAPIEFPPPVQSEKEFIGGFQDGEDERIEVGVAIVGGGPAGLACANRLLALLAEDEAMTERLGEGPGAGVEKGETGGAHKPSRPIQRPPAVKELLPGGPPAPRPTHREGPRRA